MKVLSMNRGFGAALLLGLVAASSAPALSSTVPAQPLDLKGAVELAVEKSPALGVAAKAVTSRELDYSNAVAAFLPSVDFATTVGPQGPQQTGSGALANQLNLTLSESLYDNHTSIIRLAVAKRQREFAHLTLQQTRDDLTVQIATAYFRYSASQAQAEIRETQLSTLRKEFRSLSDQYNQGLKTRRDYIRLQTQLQRAELDLIAAKNTVAQNSTELRRVIGLDAESPVEFTPVSTERARSFSPILPEKSASVDQTYERSLADLQNEVNTRDIELAQRKYWPVVNVNGQITYQKSDYLEPLLPTGTGYVTPALTPWNWNALLTVQYNILDWGTRRRNIELARVQTDSKWDQLRAGLLSTDARIRSTWLDLKQLERSFKLDQELLKIEEETYGILQVEYREGRAAYLDLITELNNLLDAKSRLYTSYFDLQTRLVTYRYFERGAYESIVSSKGGTHGR